MVDDATQGTADERLHLSRLQPAIRRRGKAIDHNLVDDGFVARQGFEAVNDVTVEGGWFGRAVDAKFVAPVRDSALPSLNAIAHVNALGLAGQLTLPDFCEIPIQHLEDGVNSMELDGQIRCRKPGHGFRPARCHPW